MKSVWKYFQLKRAVTTPQVWVWRIPGGESKVLGGSGERVECGEVMQDGRRAVAGYSDGAVKIWDMKSSEQLHSLTGVHSEAVVNLTLTNTNLLMTGSSDGSVGLWNCSNGQCPHISLLSFSLPLPGFICREERQGSPARRLR